MTASEKPASTASLRRISPSDATCATSASAFFPLIVASPRRSTRSVAAPTGALASTRRRSSAPARTSASSARSSVLRSPARRASGWRSSTSGAAPSRKSVHSSRIRRSGTTLKRAASGGGPLGTKRSTARGIAAARTIAPSASRSEQTYWSAIQRASSSPVASNARGPSTRAATSRRFASSSPWYGAPSTYAKTSREPSGTRTTSPAASAMPSGTRYDSARSKRAVLRCGRTSTRRTLRAACDRTRTGTSVASFALQRANPARSKRLHR